MDWITPTTTTLIIWLIANLPLIRLIRMYGRTKSDLKKLKGIVGHAPNQFLFLLIPFGIATYSTFIAWTIFNDSNIDTMCASVICSFAGQPWLFLFAGALIASVLAVVDDRETVPDFDLLKSEIGASAVESTEKLLNHLYVHITDPKLREEKSIQLVKSGKKLLETVGRAPSILNNSLEEHTRFLLVVCDPTEEERESFRDPWLRWLNVAELIVALLVAWYLIWGIAIIFLVDNDPSLDRAGLALTFALICFAFYPAFRRFNRAEVEAICRKHEGFAADFWVLALVFILAILITFNYFDAWENLSKIATIVVWVTSIATYSISRLTPHSVGRIIGTRAGLLNNLVAIFIFGFVLFLGFEKVLLSVTIP